MEIDDFVFSDSPKEELKEEIKSIFSAIQPDNDRAESFKLTHSRSLEAALNFVDVLDLNDEPDLLSMLPFVVKSLRSNILGVENTNITSSLLDYFRSLNTAYALEFGEVYESAKRCKNQLLKIEKIKAGAAMTQKMLDSSAYSVTFLNGVADASSNPKVKRFKGRGDVILGVLTIAGLLNAGYVRPALINEMHSAIMSCKKNVFYPNDDDRSLFLSIKDSSLNEVRKIKSGVKYSLNLNIKADSFSKYRMDGKNKHGLYKLITLSESIYGSTQEEFDANKATLISIQSLAGVLEKSSLVSLAGEQLIEEHGNRIAEALGDENNALDEELEGGEVLLKVHSLRDKFDIMAGEGVKTIAQGNGISFIAINPIDSRKIKVEKVFDRSEDVFDSIDYTSADSYSFEAICTGETMFPLKFGAGLVSSKTIVSGNVYVENGAFVCGNSSLRGHIAINNGVYLSDSSVGNENSRGLIIHGNTTVVKSTIKANRIKECAPIFGKFIGKEFSTGSLSIMNSTIGYENNCGSISNFGGTVVVDNSSILDSSISLSAGLINIENSSTIKNSNFHNSNPYVTISDSSLNKVSLRESGPRHTKISGSSLGKSDEVKEPYSNYNVSIGEGITVDQSVVKFGNFSIGARLKNVDVLEVSSIKDSFANNLNGTNLTVGLNNVISISGNVDDTEEPGIVNVVNAEGEVELAGKVEGEVYASNIGKSVSLEGIDGSVNFSNIKGKIEVSNIKGGLSVSNVFGDVIISQIDGDLSIGNFLESVNVRNFRSEGGFSLSNFGTAYSSLVMNDVVLNGFSIHNVNIRDIKLEGFTAKNASIRDCELGTGVVMTDSHASLSTIGDSVILEKQSSVDRSIIKNGVTISDSIITGGATKTVIFENKYGKECDGIKDTDEDDPCVAN